MKQIDLVPNQPAPQTSQIIVGTDLIGKVAELCDLDGYSKVFVVTDEKVGPLWLDKLLAGLPQGTGSIAVAAGEQHKDVAVVQTIWAALRQAGCDRKSLVINLGGGVVTDMGGFAASTYMRGIDFINIPTTLLAQVDASVGGKTGIDFGGIKNLVGTFNQPTHVVIDTDTLATLPDDHLASGFAEVIKHGLIIDKAYFDMVTSKPPRQFSAGELAEIVYGSCRIKADIVAKDPKEQGLRKLVNFGHTIGHAIESISLEGSRPLLHGQAVAIGMVAEAKLSQLLGMVPEAEVTQIEEALQAAGLPVAYPGLSMPDVWEKMRADKKNERGTINFTLLEGIGKSVYNQQASADLVAQAVAYVSKGSA